MYSLCNVYYVSCLFKVQCITYLYLYITITQLQYHLSLIFLLTLHVIQISFLHEAINTKLYTWNNTNLPQSV